LVGYDSYDGLVALSTTGFQPFTCITTSCLIEIIHLCKHSFKIKKQLNIYGLFNKSIATKKLLVKYAQAHKVVVLRVKKIP